MEIAARPSPVQPRLVLAAAQRGKERRRQRETGEVSEASASRGRAAAVYSTGEDETSGGTTN
ncbi:hypothetical protein [Oryza sativa Japonica Group]|uniref:Uncharacterized protein n=1 Tax=Oryza sativa subsp. japonica TaxID=39947 RepID=Q5ZBK0_ORYSJ|nr:hypothetical protein [Oryza sativa Japonica Group]BAD53076.1 hypothetical protein [Oryza sativa Japonica Group]